MTGYKKVFLDTTPLIYFLDSDVYFGEKVREISGQLRQFRVLRCVTVEEWNVEE